jgi:hypothetical protein
VHVVAVSHCPLVAQVSICVSLVHIVVPGTHTPPQLVPIVPRVPTHAFEHAVAAPHCPVVAQAST